MKKLHQRSKPTETQKRGPLVSGIDTVMQVIFFNFYLEENEDQYQFSLEEFSD